MTVLEDGMILLADSENDRVVEVNQAGETLWSAPMPDNPYEADRVPGGEPVGGPTYEPEDVDDDVATFRCSRPSCGSSSTPSTSPTGSASSTSSSSSSRWGSVLLAP